jgi:hypothetical protein
LFLFLWQGLDVKRHNYDLAMADLHADVRITVTDYNNMRTLVHDDITNVSLRQFLNTPRPDWSRVRWINVQVGAAVARSAIQALGAALSARDSDVCSFRTMMPLKLTLPLVWTIPACHNVCTESDAYHLPRLCSQ